MLFRNAIESDSVELMSLIHQAKAHWGYPREWLDAWQTELTISPIFIKNNDVVIIVDNDNPLAFYGLELSVSHSSANLEHLWVSPAYIGQGLGDTLFKMACKSATDKGFKALEILSDPNAEGFYRKQGAIKIGNIESEVIGIKRSLPKMLMSL